MYYALLLCFFFFQCSLLYPIPDDELTETDGYWHVCKERCLNDYPTTHGIRAKQITVDTIRCTCFRSRGDKILYLDVQRYESEENTRVDQIP